MPSVAEELAALRAQSKVKNEASKLKDAEGLSTPEAESEAITSTNKKNRTATYAKEAKDALKDGSKALDQDMDLRMQQIAKKKEDQQKQREAAQTNNAGTKAIDKNLDFQVKKIAQKKDDKEKQKEASENLQNFNLRGSGAGAGSVVAPDAAATSYDKVTPSVSQPLPKSKKETVDSTKTIPSSNNNVEGNNNDETVPNVDEIPDIDEIPELEPQTTTEGVVPDKLMQQQLLEQQQAALQQQQPRIQNRAEKKARKFLQKLGMKPVDGIVRVSLKMGGRQGVFIIQQPDVFEKNGSYIVFGEARQGGGGGGGQYPTSTQEAQQQAAAAAQMASAAGSSSAVPQMDGLLEPTAKVEEVVEEDEVVDETGVEAKDIDLVISQAGCSRAQAVKALKENDNDLVNAIMAITN